MRFIDIHTHGGFGVDFATCGTKDLKEFATKALEHDIVGFCPTLATDTFENIQRQLGVINEVKKAQEEGTTGGARVLGAHIEGIFLNPEKAGAHDKTQLFAPVIENFKKAVGNFMGNGASEEKTEFSDSERVNHKGEDLMKTVKIVTLAPELDKNLELTHFLQGNEIKVHAGHTLAKTAEGVDGTTHHFNAMPKMSHNEDTITLDALSRPGVYTEIIADGVHVEDEMLKLFFKIKNPDEVILVSDSLALAHAPAGREFVLCGKKISATKQGARNEDGTLAGSTLLLSDIAQRLVEKGILPREAVQKMAWDNPIKHLGLDSEVVESMIKLRKNK